MRIPVGLNLQPLASDKLAGIGTYTQKIAERLPACLGDQYLCEGHVFDYLGRNNAAEKVCTHLPDFTLPNIHICRMFPLGAYIRAGKLGNLVSYQTLVSSQALINVFFNFLRPEAVKGSSIITVYDMVVARYGDTMDGKNRRLLENNLHNSMSSSDAIMTISEFSKQEIIDCYQIPEKKIHIAHCGLDRQQFYPVESDEEQRRFAFDLHQKYGIDGPYLLYLGTLEPRKNVNTLIEAFALVKKKIPGIKLVLAGGLGWQYENTLSLIDKRNQDKSILRIGYIPESDKRMLYCSAKAFVFPSLYEGFGLPPLEAMACNVPVISSEASSLPEIMGDAGILFDPMRVDQLADALEKVCLDEDFTLSLVPGMKNNIERFTWDHAASIYAQVIADLIPCKSITAFAVADVNG